MIGIIVYICERTGAYSLDKNIWVNELNELDLPYQSNEYYFIRRMSNVNFCFDDDLNIVININ